MNENGNEILTVALGLLFVALVFICAVGVYL